jgi:hypothetical protein
MLTKLGKSVQRKDQKPGLACEFSTVTMPLCMIRQKFASTWLSNPLQKHATHLFTLRFLALSKIKNAPKGQRLVDIPDIQRNVTTLLRSIPENDSQYYLRQ